jgi:6-phosphogluconolactonase
MGSGHRCRARPELTPGGTPPLTPAATAFVNKPPGDGPRHFAFHPNGSWVYSLQEEASTLMFWAFDPTSGLLTPQQLLSSLPAGFAGTSFASEVMVSSNGNFLYAANRLLDTIDVFRVLTTGELKHVSEVSTRGDYPRSFNIDPTGSFLLSCNQRSDSITSFFLENGGRNLKFSRQFTPVGSPSSIVFLAPS